MMSTIELLAVGLILVAGMMVLLWIYAVRHANAGVVDIGWTAGIMIMAALCIASPGYYPRSLASGGTLLIWGARLGLHLWQRVVGHAEDPRYRQLRSAWEARANLNFLVFFQLQALLVLALSTPLLVVRLNSAPGFSFPEYAGIGLSLLAIAGEWVADRQLNTFKENAGNRGLTCRTGLWKYSRHPNYFFEWLVWMGLAMFALGSPYGYVSIVSPALMLFFLFRVTGIPATEAQALRTRSEDYARYQQSTSAFFPWFPRRSGIGIVE
jgi:steroid 5-alpha reductase family enzyme